MASEQEEGICGLVRASGVLYTFVDDGYAGWEQRQDLLETVRTHREEIVAAIKLPDVAAVDRVLTDRNERKRLFDLLQIEPRKWATLVEVSDLLKQGREATIERGMSLRRQYVEFLCGNIEAILKRTVEVDDDLALLLSAFEIQMPAVKFHGFDRILAVTLSCQEGTDLGRAMMWSRSVLTGESFSY